MVLKIGAYYHGHELQSRSLLNALFKTRSIYIFFLSVKP